MTDEQLLDHIPPAYRARFTDIVALTDEFCDRHLNDEYKAACRRMAVHLCQEGSPVLRGKTTSWACGLMYAVGTVNFLTDPDQTPHMKADQIAAGFGVSQGTMYAKNREIQHGLNLTQLDPEFTIDSLIGENPFIWMIEVDGLLMDMRHAPRELQVVAYERGLIPYVPADQQADG